MTKKSKQGKLDIATELALGGLVLSTMGVVHGWTFYERLGVNIFDYIAPTDFVVFALKSPGSVAWAVLFTVVASFWLRAFPLRLVLLVLFVSAATAWYAAVRDADAVTSDAAGGTARPPCKITYETDARVISVVGATVLGNAGGFVVYHKDRSTYLVRADRIVDLACPRRANLAA